MDFASYIYRLLISIHALLAESDLAGAVAVKKLTISIHALLAESDSTTAVNKPVVIDFYPRSPCGERQADTGQYLPFPPFLSTLSLRRATV